MDYLCTIFFVKVFNIRGRHTMMYRGFFVQCLRRFRFWRRHTIFTIFWKHRTGNWTWFDYLCGNNLKFLFIRSKSCPASMHRGFYFLPPRRQPLQCPIGNVRFQNILRIFDPYFLSLRHIIFWCFIDFKNIESRHTWCIAAFLPDGTNPSAAVAQFEIRHTLFTDF